MDIHEYAPHVVPPFGRKTGGDTTGAGGKFALENPPPGGGRYNRGGGMVVENQKCSDNKQC